MYGERFDIPDPDELLMVGWFSGGEVFRSLCTWNRGLGRVVYFQPGHETYPTYHDPNVQRVIANACRWARRRMTRDVTSARNAPALEPLLRGRTAGRVNTGEPIRVGIIGAGNISRNHVEGYLDAGANVVAVADPNRPRARDACARVGRDEDVRGLPGAARPAGHRCGLDLRAQRGAPSGHDRRREGGQARPVREADLALDRRGGRDDHRLSRRGRRAPGEPSSPLQPGGPADEVDARRRRAGRIAYVRFRQAHDWGGADTLPPTFRSAPPRAAGRCSTTAATCSTSRGTWPARSTRCSAGPPPSFETELEDAAVSLRFAAAPWAASRRRGRRPAGRRPSGVWGTKGALEWSNRTGRPTLRLLDRVAPDTTWEAPRVTTWEHAGPVAIVRHVVGFLGAVRGEHPVICTGADGKEAVRLVLTSYESAAAGLPVALV